ncbi:MAG: TetR family transcriptional regulator [Ruminococcaceae bacterium]|nr:TetR family transcriptional regulator [Oscillospiraceae bacterium]
MDNNKETKERLIESALAEFSAKGYTKSSLRKICADAGVTTGALYFFFKDKEDLFAAIVEQPFNELKSLLLAHIL